MKDWASSVIDDLCRLKAAGYTFDSAWKEATTARRMRARDGDPGETLFDAAETESLPDFVYRVAADAWHGRRPELARLQLLAESDVFPSADVVTWQPTQAGKYRSAA